MPGLTVAWYPSWYFKHDRWLNDAAGEGFMSNDRRTRNRRVSLLFLVAMMGSGCATTPEDQPPASATVTSREGNQVSSTRPSPQESMARLQQEMAAGKQAGAPTPPASPREAPRLQPPPAPAATGPCVPAQKPSWVERTGKLQGLGLSTVGQKETDGDARADLLKQFEVTVTGRDTTTQIETTDQGFRYSIASEIVESVNLAISGVSIAERFYERCTGTYYALATLEKRQATDTWVHDLQQLAQQQEEFRKQSADLQSGGQVLRAVLALHRLMETQETAAQVGRRVLFLSSESLPTLPDFGQVAATRHQIESLLASLKLRKEAGDQQRPGLSGALALPLVARVVAALPSGEVGIPDLPVTFAFQSGQGEVDPLVQTDASGKAVAMTARVAPDEAPVHIEAHIAGDQITKEFPPALARQVKERLTRESVRFVVLPSVAQWIEKLNEQAKRAEELRTRANTLRSQGVLFGAIVALHRLLEIQQEMAPVVDKVRTLDPQAPVAQAGAAEADNTRQELDSLISAIQIRKEGGDGQTARSGRALEHPLTARVVGALPGGEVPLRDVPLTFAFEAGQGKVDQRAVTDAQGRAQAAVTRVESGASAEVVARLAGEEMAADFPPALKARVLQRLSNQQVRFRIMPPSFATGATALDKVLAKLATGLAELMNDSYGQVGVVKEFVENRTRRRLSLSSRIEMSLASHLVQLGALQVRQTAEPIRGGMRSAPEKPSGEPLAAVSGVYEWDSSGGLWIQAKVVRLSNQVMEATHQESAPRDVLNEEDIRDLGGVKPATQPVAPIPPPTKDQSVREWGEALWDQQVASAFKTELEPVKPTYQVGQDAEFRFRTMRDCYLTVVNIGPTGGFTQLLPNPWRPSPEQTLVRARQGWIIIPSSEEFGFTIDPPVGTERVKAFCTTKAVQLLEGIDVRKDLLQLSPDKEQDRNRLRGMRPYGKDRAPLELSVASTQVITLEKGQQETRGMRGLRGRDFGESR